MTTVKQCDRCLYFILKNNPYFHIRKCVVGDTRSISLDKRHICLDCYKEIFGGGKE